MQTLLVSEHVVQRLNIDQNVRRTEGEKADMPRRNGVDYSARAEVKQSDWHVLFRNVEVTGAAQLYRAATPAAQGWASTPKRTFNGQT